MSTPRTAAERGFVELLRVVRSRFCEEHVDVVMRLVDVAPHRSKAVTRLTRGAYFAGFLVGMSFDSTDEKYPECPYDAKALPNFMKNRNDPRQAWRDGSRDGLRIQDIVNRPTRAVVPPLTQREFKSLTPDLQRAHDAAERAS